jgi:hypothetical protein
MAVVADHVRVLQQLQLKMPSQLVLSIRLVLDVSGTERKIPIDN